MTDGNCLSPWQPGIQTLKDVLKLYFNQNHDIFVNLTQFLMSKLYPVATQF